MAGGARREAWCVPLSRRQGALATTGDGRRRGKLFFGWYIVGASVLTNTLTTAVFAQGFQAFIPFILATFGWSRTQLSGAFAFRQVETGTFGPILGFAVDRWGPQRIIILGGVIVGLGVMGLSQIQSLWHFYVAFMVISIGFSMANHSITWPVLITRWFRRHRGRAVGIAMTGPIIGGAMALPNTIMSEAWSWRPVLFTLGAITLVVVTLLALTVQERPEQRGYGPDGDPLSEPPPAPGARMAAREPGLSVGQVLKMREFWLLTLFLGAMNMASNGFNVHQILYFKEQGLSAAGAATTAVIVVVASGIGRVGAGALTDYIDYRAVLLSIGVMMAVSQFYLVLAQPASIIASLPFTVLMGVAFGGALSVRPAMAGRMFGMRNLGAAIGLLNGGALVAGVAGPLLMGAVYDTRGSYDLAVWVLGFLSALSLGMLLLMKPMEMAR